VLWVICDRALDALGVKRGDAFLVVFYLIAACFIVNKQAVSVSLEMAKPATGASFTEWS
jgi:hypothetical protein